MNRFEDPGSSDVSEPVATGITRRTVLQAGAWAAPVITLAAAVPAASASVVETLDFTNFEMWFDWTDPGRRTGIAGCAGVFVTGDSGTSIGPVTVTVSVPITGMSETAATIDEQGTAWQPVPGAPNGAQMDYAFIWPINLIAGEAAYSTQMTFHLPTVAGTDLVPPLDWSAVAHAEGATDAARSETLANYDRTADHQQLVLQPGSLELDGSDTLIWDGASIAYKGQPQPAGVEYVVELHGPSGGVLSLLANEGASVAEEPTALGLHTYTAPAGNPLIEGNYSVFITVIGEDGITSKSTAKSVVFD